ncbi:hypothetical protein Tco_0860975 [Tanacetum coccineum]|uniref:Retrotransposon gag domain-containing protein n=1 Tax=Tanacetum coccineum TaxID=301880 RepID=A0ABQ5BJI3_9ASTR
MDENMVCLLLKNHQDAMEKLAQQQAVDFQALFDTLRAELQATLGLLQNQQGGEGNQGALLPRSMRLDVPKFLGVGPESWIFSINEYFSLLNTPVDQRLQIVGFNLEGVAAEWFQWMTRNGPYGELDKVVSPPDEIVNISGPSGELDGASTLPDGRDTTKTVLDALECLVDNTSKLDSLSLIEVILRQPWSHTILDLTSVLTPSLLLDEFIAPPFLF